MSATFSRYLQVLELLQSGSHKSASELADVLGVDKRSIRRYVEELRSHGYDIRSIRGPRGGYSFKGNVYLPPMHFTDSEALALSYGLLLLKTSTDLSRASETALARLEPVLPKSIRDKTIALRNSVDVQAKQALYNAPSENLMVVSQAISEKKQLKFRYHPIDKAITERSCDPYAIAHMIGLWFVAAYCHLRQDLRIFRVDRMTKLELLETSFESPHDFDVIKFVSEGIAHTNRGDRTKVVIDLVMSLAEAEKQIPPGRVIMQEKVEGVRTTAFVKDINEVIRFLVATPHRFEIIEPLELKIHLKKHLLQLLEQL